eukprot:CAMPEP_0119362292 /NCGR_PEP_ID=MMETSP1334-20130426/9394_1 /TAXON_ID=127549 /ORGANISM="Calcidiscus leptoporus, Strain RCC1130" /LENGTH=209 /DNA_ID=CAMNT_0007377485 /DNA_START=100 /DNA_END=731 /DNA_ORIENTATION=+
MAAARNASRGSEPPSHAISMHAVASPKRMRPHQPDHAAFKIATLAAEKGQPAQQAVSFPRYQPRGELDVGEGSDKTGFDQSVGQLEEQHVLMQPREEVLQRERLLRHQHRRLLEGARELVIEQPAEDLLDVLRSGRAGALVDVLRADLAERHVRRLQHVEAPAHVAETKANARLQAAVSEAHSLGLCHDGGASERLLVAQRGKAEARAS